MKFTLCFLVLALVTLASCQDVQRPPLSLDDVVNIIQEANPDLKCIGLQCRLDCHNNGYRSGYCEGDGCICVAPISLASA